MTLFLVTSTGSVDDSAAMGEILGLAERRQVEVSRFDFLDISGLGLIFFLAAGSCLRLRAFIGDLNERIGS